MFWIHAVASVTAVLINSHEDPLRFALTDRYFPDQFVISPDAKYEITAISPDNAGEFPRPFARDFTYTLYDIESGEALYTRKQEDGEGSPMAVHLDDSGWCVVWISSEKLMVLNPASGEVTLMCSIMEQIHEADFKRHVHHTTAGYRWSSASRWWFHEFDDRIYFVLRTGWGRYIALDLDRGEVLTTISELLGESIQADMSQETIRMLESGLKELPDAEDRRKWYSIRNAIIWAGQLRIGEAADLLRQYEEIHSPEVCLRRFSMDEREPGIVHAFSERCDLYIRRASQWSLRQIGEAPSRAPAYMFEPTGWDTTLPEHRDRPQVLRLNQEMDVVGLIPIELVEKAGSPDDQDRMARYWDYDVDLPESCTIRVFWDSEERVERVELISPPVWQEQHLRYESLIDP